MKEKDLMCKKVVTAKRSDKILDAIKLLEKNDIGMLVIINDDRKIEGVLTDRDILIRKVLKDNNCNGTINDVMTHTSVVINKDEDITSLIKKLADYQLRRLPVTNEKDELVGIVTISDIAICKQTQNFLGNTFREICLPNPQTEKPLKYLKVDDFPL